jgi:glycosyltransferase involved in cell wall biosynthesis
MKKLSVLMPVYNESRTLETIVDRVLASPVDLDIELVCVDDHSTDHSLELLTKLALRDDRIRVIAQPVNMGKGKAIRTAIEHMTGDIAIVQDADLEYDPSEYPVVLQPILDGNADAVYGSRFASSPQRRVLFFWHALGNRLLTLLSNMANDLNLTDVETCYKAIRADVLKSLRLTSDRFGFEPEVTARLAQWGARIYEVPISYHGRSYAEGKNIGWRDGVEALWLILKFRFLDTRATNVRSLATRQSVARAPRFRRWLLGCFGDCLGQRVIEFDAGPGHTTSHLLDRETLVVTDSDRLHVETLHRRFGHMQNVSVVHVDDPAQLAAERHMDTALLLDGLQRSEDPKGLLAAVAGCLDSGGHVLIQVPQGVDLYGETDRGVGHIQRFERTELEDVIRATGLEIVEIRDFNRLGHYAWKAHHAFGSETITAMEARLFDLFVPVAKRLDPILSAHGLSLLAVVRVP